MLLGIVLHAGLSFVVMPWPVQDTQQNALFGLMFAAIHGFRMPLFFLVSGFFTAMLWRRRGLAALLGHRTRRILLPCLLGLITIIPAMNWVTGWAMSTAGKTDFAKMADPSNMTLVEAIRANNIEIVRERLDEGSDPSKLDVETRCTPIAWAAMIGKPKVVELLVEHGADVNARNADKTTPLHCAAFLGRIEVAEVLLAADADKTLQDERGTLPIDSAKADWGTTQFIGGLIRIDVNAQREHIEQGRKRIGKLLGDGDSTIAKAVDDKAAHESEDDDESQSFVAAYAKFMGSNRFNISIGETSLHLIATPVFHHLWFLWFLMWMLPFFAVYVVIVETTGLKLPRALIVSPLRLLWLLPLTLLPQLLMGAVVPIFGPDTSVGVIPQPHILIYYGIFFGFGVLYFDCDDHDGQLGKWWWLSIPVAGLSFAIGLVTMALAKEVSAVAQVIFCWSMTFGSIGFFRQILHTESKALRYLSDSSYWLYIAHLPLVIGAQAVVRDWPVPSLLKFLLICVVTTAFLLLTYQYLVRYTLLGRLLNGPRKRPEKAMDVVDFEAV